MVEIPVDTTELVDKELVAFEQCKYFETDIAIHEDIEDEGQTVKVVEQLLLDSSSMPQTGDHIYWLIGVTLVAIGASVGGMCFYVNRRKRNVVEK